MACPAEDTIAAFVEGRLAPSELQRVDSHSATCTFCQDLIGVALATGKGAATRPGCEDASLIQPAASSQIGRYQILQPVGRGGMGEVYAAYDPELDRKVALKLLQPRLGMDRGSGEARLLREARVLAKLSHPNVVTVFDAGTFAGRVFIAMEFVEGKTLAAWLRERTRSWREIVSAFVHAARGLSAAHRAGLVHRDFKPQNVMVATTGEVRVMDFGLARQVGEPDLGVDPRPNASPASPLELAPTVTVTGERLGTPLFMAPEQFTDGTVDARSDQFSFCVALFWALYGAHPFGAGSPPERGAATVETRRPSSAAPTWVRSVLERGLSVDPSVRWPSMDHVATALSRDPERRRRIVVAVATAVAACVGLGIGVSHVVERHRHLCSDGSARLAGIWEIGDEGRRPSSRREAVRAAISKLGSPNGDRIWGRVSTLLDRRMSTWLSTYRDSCEATNVRHEQSAEMLDLRTECLNDALDSTRAFTDVLAQGKAAVVERAGDAVASLGTFERCSDVSLLRAAVRPPKDPLIRARVSALQMRLRDATAATWAGDWVKSDSIASAVRKEAQSLHYCPLEAEALLAEGGQADAQAAGTLSALEQALVAGERCGMDRVVAEASMKLVGVYATTDPGRVEQYIALSRAALERSGGDAHLEGVLARSVGAWLVAQGRVSEAARELARGLDLVNRVNPESAESGVIERELCATLLFSGRPKEALTHADASLRLGREMPDSGALAIALLTRAEVLVSLNRLDEGERDVSEALVIFKKGGHPSGLGLAQGCMGEILLARGKAREALPLLERNLQVNLPYPPLYRAEAEFEVAKARGAIWPGDGQAIELARKADAVFSAQPDLAGEHDRVAAWLATQRNSRVVENSKSSKSISRPRSRR